jgi:hypothetical protein
VESHWSWPINLSSYDCFPGLTETERQEIALIAAHSGVRPKRSYQVLHRLLTPLVDICKLIQENYTEWTNQNRRASTIRAFVLEMKRRQTSFWAWDEKAWIEFIAASLEEFNTRLGWSWRRDSKPEAGTRTRVLLSRSQLFSPPDCQILAPRRCRASSASQDAQSQQKGTPSQICCGFSAAARANAAISVRAFCGGCPSRSGTLLMSPISSSIVQVLKFAPLGDAPTRVFLVPFVFVSTNTFSLFDSRNRP